MSSLSPKHQFVHEQILRKQYGVPELHQPNQLVVVDHCPVLVGHLEVVTGWFIPGIYYFQGKWESFYPNPDSDRKYPFPQGYLGYLRSYLPPFVPSLLEVWVYQQLEVQV